MVTACEGVRQGLVTYSGQLTDEVLAERYGMHALDTGILLTQTN